MSKRRTTRWTKALLERYYADTPNDFEHFARQVRQSLGSAKRVLDLGAGAGIIDALDWRGTGRRVYGVDLDPRVGTHPHLDGGVLGDACRLPFPDACFDAVVSVNVLEHIPNPVDALREVHRVLAPGGVFWVKTPNRNHYIGRIARLTPTWFHEWYNSLRGRAPEDTFPTVYRFNCFADMEQVSKQAGFAEAHIDGFEGVPEYLLLSALLFYPGLFFERWVNASPRRNRYRASLEAQFVKQRQEG